MLRGKALEWLVGACCACALLGLNACMLSFDDYPEADLCAASVDAGFHPSTAPDPALRGCDAGPPPMPAPDEDAGQGFAGASSMDGAE